MPDGDAEQVNYLPHVALQRAPLVAAQQVAQAGMLQQIALNLGKRQGPPAPRSQPLHEVQLAEQVGAGMGWGGIIK